MIDLRSDTVTRPTTGMLNYMTQVEVGDDVFGEDPTVNAFEERVANLFGQEAGLFVPSGTMSNQLCLNVLTQPGDEVILDEFSHIFNYESGAGAALSGVQLRPLSGNRGIITAAQVEDAIRPINDWDPHSRVVALENTTNKGGGSYYSLPAVRQIRQVADKHGLFMHLDGARIWNALVEADYDAESMGMLFDTVSVCFSKGLGAPVGSMMLSSKENIKKARRVRKMLGGGMRQTGILAAAAEYALDHHFDLLETDHNRAQKLARVIAKRSSFSVDVESVKTNIILFDTPGSKAEDVLEKLADAGIMMTAFGPHTIRAVFHFQITDDDFLYVLDYFRNH